MSRHAMNKLMRQVNMDEASHAAYIADPAAFVAAWEDSAHGDRPDPSPHPPGGMLLPEERAALASRDFGVLYALGAHPYLLWSFTEAVWSHELPRAEIVRRFKERAAEVGHPDFAT